MRKILALVLVSSFVSAACSSTSTPSSPSLLPSSSTGAAGAPASSGIQVTSEVRNVEAVSVTEDSFEVIVTTDEETANVKMQNGQVFANGRRVCLSDRPSDSDRVQPKFIQAAIVIAATAYSAYEVIKTCAYPLYTDIRTRTLSQTTLENCTLEAASAIATYLTAGWFKAVGVTKMRTVLKGVFGSAITWSELRTVLNKGTFRSVLEVIKLITDFFYNKVYTSTYNALKQL